MAFNSFKRGDSFVVDATETTIDGVVASMAGWSIASQIRRADNDELIADLDFSWTDIDIGAYRLEEKVTTGWPLTLLRWDVKFIDPDGYVASSQTFSFTCIRQETRA